MPRFDVMYHSGGIEMDFEAFLEKQEEIYQNFRDAADELRALNREPELRHSAEGIVPSPVLEKQTGGYIVALRHSEDIVSALSLTTYMIGDATPAIVYDERNAHTTVSTYGISEGFTPEDKTLDMLCSAVQRSTSAFNVMIELKEWLFSRDTAIIAGYPNVEFLALAETVCSYAAEDGVDLRLPWGAHITAARFTEPRSPAEMTELLNIMGSALDTRPLGLSIPEKVVVGHFLADKSEFALNVYEEFSI
ncbi:hypothetical protein KY362_02820 [Candidatus Woesearchaeota archaeon]|nr:hypothetical protein [Candidatus Woesearchaeota archaeon]